MSFVKLLLSFAPWLAFLIIARGSIARVEIALVVALALSVVMAALKLHRGIIMWVGLVFFTAATIAVVGFHNMWTIRHLGVLFIRVNVLLTAVWAATFTVITGLAWLLMKRLWPEWACHTASYAALIAAAAFTSWYPAHVRATHQRPTSDAG